MCVQLITQGRRDVLECQAAEGHQSASLIREFTSLPLLQGVASAEAIAFLLIMVDDDVRLRTSTAKRTAHPHDFFA